MTLPFDVEYVNDDALVRRYEEISRTLLNLDYLEDEGIPLTRQDLDDLAAVGALDSEDRDLYDELNGIEFMLGRQSRG
ncbi:MULTISPECIES: hypothetical protein [unclassified Corynebacterium]|uniref:hypothetical protein n=1 Tax=unclassified Corynebacterium TaxID=2624378 RepID=UPI0029CA3237|nr:MULTISPECIES: hypothetical protein [unclassified Corynebacterium]WPF65942.1 hypothetical protein OLX12_10365 [Corynebacterium sp. 22KM0430]WPF68435.1 hypothetical protein OLW90_10360 [Corynebacterium sp. 21KM1197]